MLKHQLMGILNLTPNSFSDGGVLRTSESVYQKILALREEGARIIDLGAESTAPKNNPITMEQEQRRFEELFFPIIQKLPGEDWHFSIDTYRPETFLYVAKEIRLYKPQSLLWWNDISGQVDEKTKQTLKEVPSAHYVLCHNRSSSRAEASHHLKFCLDAREDVIDAEIRFFTRKLERAKGLPIILDPGFGFSKTREQNIQLLERLPELLREFSQYPWLVGISRKSFLRSPEDDHLGGDLKFQRAEKKHIEIIKKWRESLADFAVTFRVHSPAMHSRP